MPWLQILGKVRKYFIPEIKKKKKKEDLGEKNSYLENFLMGNKFGLGQGQQ